MLRGIMLLLKISESSAAIPVATTSGFMLSLNPRAPAAPAAPAPPPLRARPGEEAGEEAGATSTGDEKSACAGGQGIAGRRGAGQRAAGPARAS